MGAPTERERDTARLRLAGVLALIELNDTNYERRYELVLAAMHYASQAGYPVGIALDPQQPDWPVVYIELPTGQVSWHMPAHPTPYDGHTTAEKYARIHAYRPDPAPHPACGSVDPSGDAVCILPAGHDGPHDDGSAT